MVKKLQTRSRVNPVPQNLLPLRISGEEIIICPDMLNGIRDHDIKRRLILTRPPMPYQTESFKPRLIRLPQRHLILPGYIISGYRYFHKWLLYLSYKFWGSTTKLMLTPKWSGHRPPDTFDASPPLPKANVL